MEPSIPTLLVNQREKFTFFISLVLIRISEKLRDLNCDRRMVSSQHYRTPERTNFAERNFDAILFSSPMSQYHPYRLNSQSPMP